MYSIKDGLYGFVIGDAMGVPIEFTSRTYEKTKKLKEMVGYGSHRVPEGTWSDDTSMTLATIDSLQENKEINYNDIMDKFVEWYRDAKYTATDVVFDIGGTTSHALRKYYRENVPAIECGEKDERSNGNGSLMRFLPIADYLSSNNYTEEEEYNIIRDVSSLTHGHEISVLGCAIYTNYIKELNKGNDKYTAYKNTCKYGYEKYFSKESINKYNRILDGNLDKIKEIDIDSSGYVLSTLEASLWCVLNTTNYEDCIVEAINLGSDTDTVGAITGSLAGKIYGYNSIPTRWLDKLRKKEYLDNLCEKFDKVIINHECKDEIRR